MTNENNFNFDGDNYEEYFTTFSSKEEYLLKRSEWRDLYRRLSLDIRHNKHVKKEQFRAVSRVEKSLCIVGQYWYQLPDSKMREYRKELLQEQIKIPDARRIWYDATELLKVRHEMKDLSRQQREESLKSLV